MTRAGIEQQGAGVGRSKPELRPELTPHLESPAGHAPMLDSGKLPRCSLWGVLNVTPDSFSDGGRFIDCDVAVAAGVAMAEAGACVIDVGGASSRPPGLTYGAGAAFVALDEEIARVVPVIRQLADQEHTVSIDTARGAVARAALEAGARLVNDVSMGADPELLAAAAAHDAQLVLMHNRGDGRVDETGYGDIVDTVAAELASAVERARAAGVRVVWIDPGLGFAKTADQSAELLARLEELKARLPRIPLLVGASRKSFLGRMAPDLSGGSPPPMERLAGSLVAACFAARNGADAVRIHDVAATRQALLVDSNLTARARGRRD